MEKRSLSASSARVLRSIPQPVAASFIMNLLENEEGLELDGAICDIGGHLRQRIASHKLDHALQQGQPSHSGAGIGSSSTSGINQPMLINQFLCSTPSCASSFGTSSPAWCYICLKKVLPVPKRDAALVFNGTSGKAWHMERTEWTLAEQGVPEMTSAKL